ncbi:MAG: hypothetical protein ACTTIC_07445 [Helicobacteraceae bacterium]
MYCPQCGFSKIVRFQSDALGGAELKEMLGVCPKCGARLEKKSGGVDLLSEAADLFKRIFK